MVAFRRNHPMAHRCRRVGAVHHIIHVIPATPACPVRTQEQTSGRVETRAEHGGQMNAKRLAAASAWRTSSSARRETRAMSSTALRKALPVTGRPAVSTGAIRARRREQVLDP